MSEKIRDEFEAWFYGESGLKCKFDSHGDAYVTEPSRTTGDTIVNSSCCIAWQAWQASRAALVVELPDSLEHTSAWYDYASDAFEETIESVKCALDEADINYK